VREEKNQYCIYIKAKQFVIVAMSLREEHPWVAGIETSIKEHGRGGSRNERHSHQQTLPRDKLPACTNTDLTLTAEF